jgi:hypothetical protein
VKALDSLEDESGHSGGQDEHRDRRRLGAPGGVYHPALQPQDAGGQGIGSSGQTAVYSRNKPSDLNLKLILDGSGPLLSKEVYGSSEHYLFVAVSNGLDYFRNLTPGLEIFFPPLEKG